MIYLEFNNPMTNEAYAVEITADTIAEAAKLFMAFNAGLSYAGQTEAVLTNISTGKSRGVKYERWAGL